MSVSYLVMGWLWTLWVDPTGILQLIMHNHWIMQDILHNGMKISDLTEKGPVIGAPKGSQKDARLSPGTDDPSKYMRGGEWEAYREPQGVNSPAGKIAGGVKKGTTRTKNKKTSESLEEYMGDGPGLMANPNKAYMKRLAQQAIRTSRLDPHIKGLYDPRGTFWVWDSMGEQVHHAEIEVELIERYGMPEFEDWWDIIESDVTKEGYSAADMESMFDETGGFIPFLIDVDESGTLDNPWVAYPSALQQPAVRQAFTESLRRMFEGPILPAGGPGASGDLVPRHRDATTINMVKDKDTPTRERTPMANNKAPIKQAKSKVAKSLTNTPGNTKAVNESVPRQNPREYNADYTLRDDRDTEDLGEARVRYGVIELLAVRNDFAEDFNGHVMSRLMSTIVNDADLANANLAIQLDDPSDIQHKRFMERFGFRETENGIMKRNAGSVRPPSVPTARL